MQINLFYTTASDTQTQVIGKIDVTESQIDQQGSREESLGWDEADQYGRQRMRKITGCANLMPMAAPVNLPP